MQKEERVDMWRDLVRRTNKEKHPEKLWKDDGKKEKGVGGDF